MGPQCVEIRILMGMSAGETSWGFPTQSISQFWDPDFFVETFLQMYANT